MLNENSFLKKTIVEPDDLEEKAEALLASFPAELQKKWRDFFDESEDQEAALARLKEVADKRESLNQSPIDDDDFKVEFTDEAERQKNEWKASVLDDIRKILKTTATSIGIGKTAKIFKKLLKDNTDSDYCLKVIHDTKKPEYARHNDIKSEFFFLEKLADINIDGARVPRPYAYIKNKGAHIMAMERLDAFTIDQVLSGEETLPNEFDIESFFAKLEGFLSEMHRRKIYHRDLHGGNIMIDRKTFAPLVIDFGTAKEDFYSENPYIDEFDYFGNDLNKAEEHKKNLTALLNRQKGGQRK